MIKNILSNIELIVYDFDGVMTDNAVIVNEHGIESVRANRGDGYAISKIKAAGIDQIIISAEINPVVSKRAEKLNILAIQSTDKKEDILSHYCDERKILLSKVMFIGNDLNDYGCMLKVGLRGCPSDAEPEIIEICEWRAKAKGGCGVIRELYRDLMNALGKDMF